MSGVDSLLVCIESEDYRSQADLMRRESEICTLLVRRSATMIAYLVAQGQVQCMHYWKEMGPTSFLRTQSARRSYRGV